MEKKPTQERWGTTDNEHSYTEVDHRLSKTIAIWMLVVAGGGLLVGLYLALT